MVCWVKSRGKSCWKLDLVVADRTNVVGSCATVIFE